MSSQCDIRIVQQNQGQIKHFKNIKRRNAMWDPYADFEKKTLSNGLDLYLLEIPEVAWVRTGFVIHSGACQDEIGKEGTAHFVEHLVSENISIGSDELSAFFNGCGGNINLGMTDYLYTQYGFLLPAVDNLIEEGFGYMSSMLIGSVLEDYIERERRVIIAEFLEEYPLRISSNHFLQHKKECYKDTCLSRFLSPAGKYKSIGVITQRDIQRYYDLYYIPMNMSIIFVGNISWDKIFVLLNGTHFLVDSDGECCKYDVLSQKQDVKKNVVVSRDSKFVFHENGIKGVEQSMYKSMTKLSYQHSLSALDIFSAMLNQELFITIREELSVSYEFYAQFYRYHDFVEFSIKGVFDGRFDDVRVDERVQSCINSIMSDEVLFELVKNGLVNEMYLLDVNGKEILYSVITDIVFNNRIKILKEEIEEMKCVTFEDVINIGKELARECRYVYIQVP
jgi:predicted Zn-dependent peptidase